MTDAALDRHISAVEYDRSLCPCQDCMRAQHDEAVEAGVLDADQPTPWSHRLEVKRMTAPLTKHELWMLRASDVLSAVHGTDAEVAE